MSKTRYRLKAIYDEVYGITVSIDTPLPLNTPIMFIRIGGKKAKRLGFKRMNAPTPPKGKQKNATANQEPNKGKL